MSSPRGSASPSWKGGSTISGGYVRVLEHDHPRAVRGRVLGHVLVVERALGHYLDSKHPVHHVDEDGTNNAPNNLVVCEDQAYHSLLHQRQRALDTCGNPDAKPCRICKKYDRQEEIRRAWGPRASHHHASCKRDYDRERGYGREYQRRKRADALSLRIR